MSTLNLNELGNRMIKHFLPTAVLKQNLLVNQIPADLAIKGDRKLAASVVHTMLSAIITQTENSCIRLSARIFDGIILLTVTDGAEYNDCAVIEGLQEAPVVSMPVTRGRGGFFQFPGSAA